MSIGVCWGSFHYIYRQNGQRMLLIIDDDLNFFAVDFFSEFMIYNKMDIYFRYMYTKKNNEAYTHIIYPLCNQHKQN